MEKVITVFHEIEILKSNSLEDYYKLCWKIFKYLKISLVFHTEFPLIFFKHDFLLAPPEDILYIQDRVGVFDKTRVFINLMECLKDDKLKKIILDFLNNII